MPIATLSNASIHYRLEGPVQAPVILLSNSLGTDMRMWDAQAAALCGEFRLLRYDTRGHGGSSQGAGPCTLDDLGKDLIELFDFLDIGKAHVCGVSLGGMTVLWFALHHPERVCSVMACNTAARIGSVDSWNQRIAHVATGGLESIADATMQRWFTEGFRRSNPACIEQTRSMFCSTNAEGYMACCEALRDADLRPGLQGIRVPVLTVAGSHDPVTPPSDGHYLQQHIPAAKYAELPAAHLSNIEQAAVFTALMRQFVSVPQ